MFPSHGGRVHHLRSASPRASDPASDVAPRHSIDVAAAPASLRRRFRALPQPATLSSSGVVRFIGGMAGWGLGSRHGLRTSGCLLLVLVVEEILLSLVHRISHGCSGWGVLSLRERKTRLECGGDGTTLSQCAHASTLSPLSLTLLLARSLARHAAHEAETRRVVAGAEARVVAATTTAPARAEAVWRRPRGVEVAKGAEVVASAEGRAKVRTTPNGCWFIHTTMRPLMLPLHRRGVDSTIRSRQGLLPGASDDEAGAAAVAVL